MAQYQTKDEQASTAHFDHQTIMSSVRITTLVNFVTFMHIDWLTQLDRAKDYPCTYF